MKPLPYKPLLLPLIAATLVMTAATLSRRPAPRAFVLDPITPIHTDLIPPSIAATQPIHHAYLDRLVPPNHSKSMTIDQIAAFIEKATQVDILVDWRTLEAAGIERENPLKAQTILQAVPLSEFLRDALPQFGGGVGIGFRADDHRLTITTQEMVDRISVLRIYDVRDLILSTIRARRSLRELTGEPPPDYNPSQRGIIYADSSSPPPIEETICAEISGFLTETVDVTSWIEHGGHIGTIHYYAGHLIITQTPDNHEQVQAHLNLLRQSLAAPDNQILRLHEPEPGITSNPPTEEHATTVTRIYNVRDLLTNEIAFRKLLDSRANTPTASGAADSLIEALCDVILQDVDYQSWTNHGGQVGWIKSLSGQLIILQTPANHDKIASLLSHLRQSLKSPTTHPAQ